MTLVTKVKPSFLLDLTGAVDTGHSRNKENPRQKRPKHNSLKPPIVVVTAVSSTYSHLLQLHSASQFWWQYNLRPFMTGRKVDAGMRSVALMVSRNLMLLSDFFSIIYLKKNMSMCTHKHPQEEDVSTILLISCDFLNFCTRFMKRMNWLHRCFMYMCGWFWISGNVLFNLYRPWFLSTTRSARSALGRSHL